MADKLHTLAPVMRGDAHPARLWEPLAQGRVQCNLSPKRCRIPVGGLGFCGVRYNQGGKLVTLNYGKSVPITEERIESEAVYHYQPGARILSLGNIGCMLHCDFCQNWATSQARRVRNEDVALYTPQQIVDYALEHGIGILSWTYNDPVVWHEFIMDTARLARQAGLKNLYKSAFSIGPQAIAELLEVIDIFSVSLKSLSPAFYRKHTLGELQPVLDGILQVYAARRDPKPGAIVPHLEISNLCVTGRNDNLEEAHKVAEWMLAHLDPEIPLHYVRFHPDYKYTQVGRTDVGFLESARQQALAMGLKHVYLGNTPDTLSVNTHCSSCGGLVFARAGDTRPSLVGSGPRSVRCGHCGHDVAMVVDEGLSALARRSEQITPAQGRQTISHTFRTAIDAVHVEQSQERRVDYVFLDAEGREVGGGHSACLRFLVVRPGPQVAGLRLHVDDPQDVRLLEVFDRAHFPTMSVAHSVGGSADTPPAPVALV
ncbi:MAG: AmmeMemoRadiSam system radical enzyme [Pseudomonadota bacterium]|jgi:pyruvate formate lyase activating enzyme